MIVFVLRHGEREPDPADALRPAGEERARLLARMLAESGVAVALHSDFKRTRRMLAPLEAKLAGGLALREVKIRPPADPAAHIDGIVEAVKAESADRVIAVVTHSNTVGAIVARLGGGAVEVADHEFDKLFVLFIGPAGTTLLRLRYGAPT